MSDQTESHAHAPVRLVTIVWGAILAAVGVALIAVAAGASIDVELALIIGLSAAGLALVVAPIIAAARTSAKRKRVDSSLAAE